MEGAAERHVPLVAQVPRGHRVGVAGHAVRAGRVVHRHDRLGVETPVGGPELVLRGLGLIELAEGALVHKRKMRVVEGVFHEAHAAALPELVELVDTAELRVRAFGHARDVGERLLECHPGVAVTLLAAEGIHLRAGGNHRLGALRDAHATAGAVEGPAVVAADEAPVLAKAFRQPRGAVAAAVAHRGGFALGVQPQDDLLSEKGERLRAVAGRNG